MKTSILMTMRIRFPKCSNITLLILVKFLTSLYFYIPYMTLYFLGLGFNFIQINSIWGIIVFVTFLAEVPTGILADRWGRRRAIQAAIFLQFIGELMFLFITDYWLLVLNAIIAGIGFAFGSGALEAMIYDHLKSENQDDQMSKIIGQINSAGYIGFILSFGISSLLVQNINQENIRLAILATAISVGLGFITTLVLKPEKTFADETTQAEAHTMKIIKEGWIGLKKNRSLQHLALLSILTIAFWDYLSSLFQPYFKKIGVPDPMFGLTMALASLFAFLSARNAHKIERRIGLRKSLLIATLSPGLIYLILFLNRTPWLGILLISLFRGFNTLKHPLFADYLNRQITSRSRATVLSMINMLVGIYTALMGILIGAIAERSLLGSFLFTGVIVSAFALFIALDRSSIFAKD